MNGATVSISALNGVARCRVGVVGLGYAGLPQLVAFADAGHPVVGVDNNPAVIGTLRFGRSPVDTVRHEDLRRLARMLTVTADAAALAGCSAVLLCVPTPLGEGDEPDLGMLTTAAAAVAAQLQPGQLVVVESTVYPGVTDGVVKPILESSGLTAGRDFNLAFAPERIDPANPIFDATNTPKIIGGLTAVCARRTAELYGGVVSMVHVMDRMSEAEAAKLLENTYRQVNVALMCEFAVYCEAHGMDVAAVIEAAATKPFGFQPFYPGIGVGGHCIPVDPMYLAASGRAVGAPLRMVDLAQEINNRRPHQVAQRCMRMLRSARVPARGARVLVLGLTYKPNVADTRNTPAAALIQALRAGGADVWAHDPLVDGIDVDEGWIEVVGDVAAAVRDADLVVLAQRHSCYGPGLLGQARLLHIADVRESSGNNGSSGSRDVAPSLLPGAAAAFPGRGCPADVNLCSPVADRDKELDSVR